MEKLYRLCKVSRQDSVLNLWVPVDAEIKVGDSIKIEVGGVGDWWLIEEMGDSVSQSFMSEALEQKMLAKTKLGN